MKKDCGISASLPVPVLLKTITTTLIRLKMNNLLINKLKRVKKLLFNRSCFTAVQFILFNFASYSAPSIVMELKVSKEITCK